MLLDIHHTKLEEFHTFYLSKIIKDKNRSIPYVITHGSFYDRNDVSRLSPVSFKLYFLIVRELLRMRKAKTRIDTRLINHGAILRQKHVNELANCLEWFHIVRVCSGLRTDAQELELEKERELEADGRRILTLKDPDPDTKADNKKVLDFFINDDERSNGLEAIETIKKNLGLVK